MQNNDTIISVDEAIELLKTDTRTNPTVDTSYIAQRTHYLRDSSLFRIPLVTRDQNGRIVHNGNRFARVVTTREANILNYAIHDHYKELAGKELEDTADPDFVPVKSVDSTIKNDQVGEFSLKKGKKSKDIELNRGDTISTSPEGRNLTVGK